jgi:hypothetical protein
MIQQLSNYSDNWREMGAKVCDIETQLFNEWVAAMALELPELVS